MFPWEIRLLRKSARNFVLFGVALAVGLFIISVILSFIELQGFYNSIGTYGVQIAKINGLDTTATIGIYYIGWEAVYRAGSATMMTLGMGLGFLMGLLPLAVLYGKFKTMARIAKEYKEQLPSEKVLQTS